MLNPEERQEALNSHSSSLKEMREDVEMIQQKLGRNHSLSQKMQTIFETVDSFTEEEVIQLSEIFDEQLNEKPNE